MFSEKIPPVEIVTDDPKLSPPVVTGVSPVECQYEESAVISEEVLIAEASIEICAI